MSRRREPDDAGVSLIEILVTLSVMSVVMVVATTGILQTYRTLAATESAAQGQAELRRVYQRLDKEVRYASWVALPAKVGSAWYVELAVGGNWCRQLRFDTVAKVLQMRRWAAGSPPAADQAWQVVGSSLVVDGSAPPFQREDVNTMPYANPNPTLDAGADFAPDYYRLRVRLAADTSRVAARLDGTFSALNTSRNTAGLNTCSEGRP